jgi:hypothetical protein
LQRILQRLGSQPADSLFCVSVETTRRKKVVEIGLDAE